MQRGEKIPDSKRKQDGREVKDRRARREPEKREGGELEKT